MSLMNHILSLSGIYNLYFFLNYYYKTVRRQEFLELIYERMLVLSKKIYSCF